MAPGFDTKETKLVDYHRQAGFGSWTQTLWHKPPYKEIHLSIPSQRSAFRSLSNPCTHKGIIDQSVKEPNKVIPDPRRTREVEFLKTTEAMNKGVGSSGCRIFGVDLTDSPRGHLLPRVEAADDYHSWLSILVDSDQLSGPSKGNKPSQSSGSGYHIDLSSMTHPITAPNWTKVHKQGTALGRSVDLSRFSGYDELTIQLDRMFEFEGDLVDKKGWQVIYTDNEGDIMMFGDNPWQEFCSMVRKIYIYTKEVIDKVNAGMLNKNDLEELLVGKKSCT